MPRANKPWPLGVALGLGELPVPPRQQEQLQHQQLRSLSCWDVAGCVLRDVAGGCRETSLIAVVQSPLAFSPIGASFVNALVLVVSPSQECCVAGDFLLMEGSVTLSDTIESLRLSTV